MRGKQIQRLIADTPTGITPADAGKTYQCASNFYKTKDHPRGCGENNVDKTRIAVRAGSPPRMRGKPGLSANEYMETGITPADAGKTQYRPKQAPIVQDHPRGCGENAANAKAREVAKGSPPRMRGKPINPLTQSSMSRITPADAGKTSATACTGFAR